MVCFTRMVTPELGQQPRSWSPMAPDNKTAWPYDDSPKPPPNASTKCLHNVDKETTFYADHLFCLTQDYNDDSDSDSDSDGDGDGEVVDSANKEKAYLLDEAVTNEVLGRLNVAIDNWKETGQPFFVGLGKSVPSLLQ